MGMAWVLLDIKSLNHATGQYLVEIVLDGLSLFFGLVEDFVVLVVFSEADYHLLKPQRLSVLK